MGTASALIDAFVANCIAQDDANLTGNIRKYNFLFRDNVEVVKKLARQAGDGRIGLLPLLNHSNPQVRLEAAKFGYAVAPAECKACLEAIQAAKLPDQSLDAGMTLWRLSVDPHCLDGT